MTDDVEKKRIGFELYRGGLVRRIAPTQYLVKIDMTTGGSFFVEFKEGQWSCDCDPAGVECEHRFASQLASASTAEPAISSIESKLVCRYCGSVDISACGFRYNAYGLAHRYRCSQCLRKFSVKYSDNPNTNRPPSELLWLLSEIGMVLTKLEDLIQKTGGLWKTDENRSY